MENTNPIKLKYTLTVQDYGNGRYTAVLNGYVYPDLDKQGLLTLIGIYFDAEFDARGDGEDAPSVEAFTKEDMAGAYNEGYACGSRENTRPPGEWINTSPYDDKGECSLCCYLSKKYYKFCPNCGADMRKGGAE